VAGDDPAWGGGQVAAADHVGDAGTLDLLFGRPDACDLGQSVDGGARALIDRHAEHQSAGVRRRRTPVLHRGRGERRIDGVARGVDPRGGRSMITVDDDPPAGIELHACLLEPEALGIGRAAGGEQHGVRHQHSVGRERDTQPAAGPPHPVRAGAQDEPDPAPLELLGHQPGQLAVDGRQQAIGLADERRRNAERGEHRGELHADRATADDDDVLRHRPDRVDLVGVVDVGIVERDPRIVGRA
jgi:hypothetical protein